MNSILKFILAATGILIISVACGKTDGGDGDNGGKNDPTVAPAGKVTCKGEGIAGVVVSDGINFTVTDAQGAYELPVNPTALHVFISSPAGYSVTSERGVVMFWAKLSTVKNRASVNFELTRTGDDTRHSFVAVGDPQIRNTSREINYQNAKLVQLNDDIRALGATLPVHVMVAGDVAFNNMDIFPISRSSFSQLGQPVYYAIGNHDHKPTGKTDTSFGYDRTADADFIRNYGPTCYSFNRGMVHYIVYDDIYFKGGSDGAAYDIKVTPEQLVWIEKDLSYVTKDHAIVLMTHAPVQTRKAPTPSSATNNDKIIAMVKDYAAVQIISGHTHYNSVVDNKSVNNSIEHIVGALCGGFWEGPGLDGTVLGYKFFEVDGTNFKWEYIPAEPAYKNTTFTHFTKATTYKPLSSVSVEVNVWDWDMNWKVEYSTDEGATWKNMTRSTFTASTSYDASAYALLGTSSSDNLPNASRQWINATTTDHLFTCTVAAGTAKVKVRTTDRFGATYSRDITIPN